MGKSLKILGADFSENGISDITRYGIVYNLTNIDTTNSKLPTGIKRGGTASIKFVMPVGYTFPASVTVTGATSSYNAVTGVLQLSAATGTVIVVAAGVMIEDPTIIASQQSLSFNGVYTDPAVQTQLVVSGLFLEESISVAISGDGASSFSSSVNSISVADATQGKTVIITYNPQSAGTHTASLVLSSTGADDVTIPLVGIAKQKVDVTADFAAWQSGSSWYLSPVNGSIIRDSSGAFETSTYQVPAAYIGKKIHFTFFEYEASGGTRAQFVNVFFGSNNAVLSYLQCEDSGTPSTAIAVNAEMVIPEGAVVFGVMYPNAEKRQQFNMPEFSAYVIA